MTDYTTIRITKSTKEKIDKMNNSDMPISRFLDEFFEAVGGYVKDDVVEISREPIALTLWQIDFDNPENNRKRDITFQELRNARVRDEFYVDAPANSKNIVTHDAEVIFKDDISVILRVIKNETIKGESTFSTRLAHVGLF